MNDEKASATVTSQPEAEREAPKPHSPTGRELAEIAEELANDTIAQLRAVGLRG